MKYELRTQENYPAEEEKEIDQWTENSPRMLLYEVDPLPLSRAEVENIRRWCTYYVIIGKGANRKGQASDPYVK